MNKAYKSPQRCALEHSPISYSFKFQIKINEGTRISNDAIILVYDENHLLLSTYNHGF